MWQGVLAYVTCDQTSTARNKLSCMDYNLVDAIKTMWLWLKTKVRNFGHGQKLGLKMACQCNFLHFGCWPWPHIFDHGNMVFVNNIYGLWPCHWGNCQ